MAAWRVTPHNRLGLVKFRPVRPGGRVALVAPASAFDRAEFDAGVAELKRLGFEPVWDDTVFERQAMTAGDPRVRVRAFVRAIDELGADAVVAVRGGYGSVRAAAAARRGPDQRSRAPRSSATATSHRSTASSAPSRASRPFTGRWWNGRLAKGPTAYDPVTFLQSLGTEPLGRLPADGLETLSQGRLTASARWRAARSRNCWRRSGRHSSSTRRTATCCSLTRSTSGRIGSIAC